MKRVNTYSTCLQNTLKTVIQGYINDVCCVRMKLNCVFRSVYTDTLKYTDLKIIMWDHTIIIAISQLLHDTNACINLYHVITAFAM